MRIVAGWVGLLVAGVCGACDDGLEAAGAGGWSLEGDPAQAPPNVVVIMVDDLDLGTMDALLELGLAPRIQRNLVDAGVVFTRAFVSNPVCCPSRATFLTGQYSHNNGVKTSKGLDEEGGVDALDDTSTLATWLHDAGYRTGHIGKYLNGYGNRGLDPDVPQFRATYVPPGWDHWQATVGSTTYRMFDYRINDTVDGETRIMRYGDRDRDYQTSVLSRRAVSFIRDADLRDDQQPFFLEVMPAAPHAEADPERESRYDYSIRPDPLDLIDKRAEMALIQTQLPPSFDKPSFDHADPAGPGFVRNRPALTEVDREDLISFHRDRLAAMLAVDDLVGAVMRALADTGELDRTVVIFTSDNGWLYGEHRLVGKKVAFDEATRVPLYIRVPGVAPGQSDQLVVNADLAPTISALAGDVAGLAVDGRSLLPLLAGEAAGWRQRVLLEHWGEFPQVPTYAGLRTGDLLYVHYEASDQRELYDLRQDPFQTDNRAADPALVPLEAALAGQVAELRGCAGQSCRDLEAE